MDVVDLLVFKFHSASLLNFVWYLVEMKLMGRGSLFPIASYFMSVKWKGGGGRG